MRGGWDKKVPSVGYCKQQTQASLSEQGRARQPRSWCDCNQHPSPAQKHPAPGDRWHSPSVCGQSIQGTYK